MLFAAEFGTTTLFEQITCITSSVYYLSAILDIQQKIVSL